MKLAYRQIEPFVAKPDPAARVILIYGPDAGLIKERAATIGKTVVEDLYDPFNVCVLSCDDVADDPERLDTEARSVSMMGGDKLIRIEDAADKIKPMVELYLKNPSHEALVLLLAGALGPKSPLRQFCEKAKNAAAVPCYVEDERDLARLIRQTVMDAGKGIEPDAVQWLAANISGDRAKVRSELDKLLLYKGDEKTPISLYDANQACGVAGAQSLDDLVYSVAGRNSKAALKAYHTLMEEGVAFISVLRALQNHFRRLHLVKVHMMQGTDIGSAMKKLQPPVFFKLDAAFKAQVNGWSLHSIDKIMGKLTELEAQCKTTGMPVDTLCSQTILGISKMR